MPKIVSVEGIGNVEFPDSMDDATISHAIETEILSKPGVAKNVPGTVANLAAARLNLSRRGDTSLPVARLEPPSTDPLPPGGPVRRFIRGAGIPTSMDEIKALGTSLDPGEQLKRGNLLGLAGPLGLAAGQLVNTVGSGLGDQAGKAYGAAEQGDWGNYLRHSLGAAVPLVGPQAAEGNYAGALGTTAVLTLPFLRKAGPATGQALKATGSGLIGAAKRLPIVSGPVKGFASGFAKSWNQRPVTVPPESITPVPPTPEIPPAGTDFPMQPVRSARLPVSGNDSPATSLPINTPEQILAAKNWARHVNIAGRPPELTGAAPARLPEAVYGDAPQQPVQPIRPRIVGPEFSPRLEGGKFAPRASIPLAGDKNPLFSTEPTKHVELTSMFNGDQTVSAPVPLADDIRTLSSDPNGPMILGQIAQSPHANAIWSSVPSGSRIIGHGFESVVLETPTAGEVLRIGRVIPGVTERPNVPDVLQPIASKRFGNWTVERMPRVEMGATPTEVRRLQTELGEQGYDLYDVADQKAIDANIGRLPSGKVVVVDGGAVIPRANKVEPFSVEPEQQVSWTDRTGTNNTGTVLTKIKSRSGPAVIIKDGTGKSRFVMHKDLTK